jgi:hypothetical protein
MAKPVAKISILHARNVFITEEERGKFLHVNTDLPYYSDTVGFNGLAHAKLRKAAEALAEYSDYTIHAPDKPWCPPVREGEAALGDVGRRP